MGQIRKAMVSNETINRFRKISGFGSQLGELESDSMRVENLEWAVLGARKSQTDIC